LSVPSVRAAVELESVAADADLAASVSAAGGEEEDMVAAAAFSGVAGVREMDGAEGDGWPVVEEGSGRGVESDVSIVGSAGARAGSVVEVEGFALPLSRVVLFAPSAFASASTKGGDEEEGTGTEGEDEGEDVSTPAGSFV
jgi:hypothetical protein